MKWSFLNHGVLWLYHPQIFRSFHPLSRLVPSHTNVMSLNSVLDKSFRPTDPFTIMEPESPSIATAFNLKTSIDRFRVFKVVKGSVGWSYHTPPLITFVFSLKTYNIIIKHPINIFKRITEPLAKKVNGRFETWKLKEKCRICTFF